MKNVKKNVKKGVNMRFLQHLVFWIAAFYVLLRIFSGPETGKIDLIYTLMFILTLLPGIYLNILVLIPVFLSRRRYFLFALLLALCMIASTGLNILMFSRLVDYIFPGYYFISYYGFSDLFKFVLVFTALTTLLKLSKGWFLLMETRTELSKLEKENAETRLLALKNQVNPHFLFNSLAGIYSLVLQKAPNAPDVILKLSDFLRYILYETTSDLVPLQKEMKALTDYVDLQKLRTGKEGVVEFTVPEIEGNLRIAPLLFLPLIENCFKHGIKGAAGPVFARISFRISPEQAGESSSRELEAVFENSARNSSGDQPLKEKGIGLEILKNRLELLYTGNYRLDISKDRDVFRVEMKIPLENFDGREELGYL